jgi:hypothetical protein
MQVYRREPVAVLIVETINTVMSAIKHSHMTHRRHHSIQMDRVHQWLDAA